MPDFVKLPSERVEQLRQLSTNLNMSIADCISMFINEQIAKGNLSANLPGTSLERDGDQVTLDVGTFRSILPANAAKEYAERILSTLRPIATPAADNPFLPALNLDVKKRGMAIKLIDRNTGAEKVFSRSIAEDFATSLKNLADL